MHIRLSLFTSIALIALAGCAPEADVDDDAAVEEEAATMETEEPAMAAADSEACPVIEGRNWAAWVNAMPGPDSQMTLHVTGEIDLPTPGYEISWSEGMADRSMTPVQRLMLTVTPPDGMVAQVITTESVHYEGPALVKTYGGVIVMCGGSPLAEIDDVTVAE
jgi:hypothetical protein